MKKLVFMLSFALAGTVWAEATTNAAARSLSRRARSQLLFNKRTGGLIPIPGTKQGKIVFVNGQKRAPEAWLASLAGKYRADMHIDIEIQEGKFAFPAPQVAGNATLFVVDDPKLPSLLHAPEARWTLVNVAPLTEGRGQKPAFFEARVKKELTRGFALLAGTQTSNYPDSLLGCITKASDLDTFADDALPVDIPQRFAPYLAGFGIRPEERSPYITACREGWAPAPTNAYQQAIWDKMQAEKERGPTNGLQIPPPKK